MLAFGSLLLPRTVCQFPLRNNWGLVASSANRIWIRCGKRRTQLTARYIASPGFGSSHADVSSSLVASTTNSSNQINAISVRTIRITKTSLLELENKLLHSFENKDFLVEAMIHSSCYDYTICVETKDGSKTLNHPVSNERCEWLGDRVYGMMVSSYLYKKFPNHSEGDLSKLFDSLASRTFSGHLCLKLGLEKHLMCSPSLVPYDGSATIPRRFGNFLESCLGALYLAGGEPVVRNFFDRRIVPQISRKLDEGSSKPNYRGLLQELLMRHGYHAAELPEALQIQSIGEPQDSSNPTFCRALKIHGSTVALGTGTSKARAAQEACRQFLNSLENTDTEAVLRVLQSTQTTDIENA